MSLKYLHGRKSISTNTRYEITANIYVTSSEGEITNEIIIIMILKKKSVTASSPSCHMRRRNSAEFILGLFVYQIDESSQPVFKRVNMD